ncbi:uncharacterized protein TNCV_336381 [Trichonephila clavipes]|nr:uncharacterized protein TNCV_336381 [Trichonephila clavipes]
MGLCTFPVLSHSEIHSLHRTKMNFTRQNPPAHQWYAAMSPGLSLQCRSSRAHQTAFAHLGSGHLRGMTFVHGVKSFFICPYSLSPCSLPASAHLLDAGAFTCVSCLKIKTWCVTLLYGKVKWIWCRLSCPKGI